jgi:hypothetical protein
MHVTVFRVDAHCAYIYMMMWNPTGMVLAFSGLLLYAYVQVTLRVCVCVHCVCVCVRVCVCAHKGTHDTRTALKRHFMCVHACMCA